MKLAINIIFYSIFTSLLAGCAGTYNLTPLGGNFNSNGWDGKGRNAIETLKCSLSGGDAGFISPQGIVVNKNIVNTECNPEYGYLNSISVYLVDPKIPSEIRMNQARSAGSASFDSNGVALIKPETNNMNGQCFMLVTDTQKMLPIRTGVFSDKYLFSSPLITKIIEANNLENASYSAKEKANNLRNTQQQAIASLRGNPSYKQGHCVKISARTQDLPQKPNTPSNTETNFNAVGFCMSSARALFTSSKTNGSFQSISEDGYITQANQWSKLPPSERIPCAKSAIRQFEGNHDSAGNNIEVILMEISRIIGNGMSDAEKTEYACKMTTQSRCYSAIRDSVYKCISDAKNVCERPAREYESLKSTILSEPQRLLSQCQRDVETLRGISEADIANAEMEASLNAEEAKKILATMPADERVSLSDAICP
jgi:hypothetical protein